MGELSNWGKQNNKYITLSDGEFIEVVYHGARITQSSFDPAKETVQYKLDDKLFNSSSRKLADAMDSIPVGTKVRIGRTGEQSKTRYTIEII